MGQQLHKSDVKLIKARLDAGDSYVRIAEDMNREGYVNRRGNPVDNGDLSHFMRTTGGMRLRTRYAKRVTRKVRKAYTKKVVAAPVVQDRVVQDRVVQDVIDILTSTLSQDLKIRLIRKAVTNG